MRILAVETSTRAGGVAALDGERVVGVSLLNISLTHSERLMAMVDRLLADCGFTLDQLDGLAVSVGPGSFTGLRVGIAAVKGLALATGLPVAAVPTLDALAAALPFCRRAVCPVLDARKGEVYVSLYRSANGTMARRWDYLALPPAQAAARIESPAVLLGDAAEACLALVPAGADVCLAPPAQRIPSPALVAQLGHRMLAAGAAVAVDDLVPIYLRPSEAELGVPGEARRG
jgi:tRNA threonylcarbamoyladenosine biosynthesis protein TsaB